MKVRVLGKYWRLAKYTVGTSSHHDIIQPVPGRVSSQVAVSQQQHQRFKDRACDYGNLERAS